MEFLSIVLHIDQHLNSWVSSMGPWIYVLLFFIIFCETGLVITPFLPGDSLLFALGAIAAIPESSLSALLLFFILTIAAIIGDTVNYSIGKFIGPKVFHSKKIPLLNQQHLIKTQKFYEKHGGKTIVWARFIPIIRTFAPFVAGIGEMNYQRFLAYNVFGAIFWISSFLTLGYLFGNLPIIQKNFHIVIFAIIIISFLPVLIEYLKSLKAKSP
jgi:membrane-associated protein